MAFNSVSFFIFFASAVLLFYLVTPGYRWYISLACSCLFYAFIDIKALAILIIATLLDYYIALAIDKISLQKTKKRLLLLSLSINILLIAGFKYLTLISSSIYSILSIITDINLKTSSIMIMAPVGISFFCFKKMSYVIDVYRGTIQPERHIGYFTLYVSHFLEILSGPIDRAGDLIPQLKSKKPFDVFKAKTGSALILWGLFLKVVIADRLAIYTDAIFNNVSQHNGPSLLLSAYFYSFQIYCDFAGYTNIAIGCGRILGYELAPNFNLPYFSQSIADFWRRWHMSLSFWFRDYLYIPLGGNRCSTGRRYYNVMIVFLLCGLWHGANWTFVVWGGIHGLLQVIGLMTKQFRTGIYRQLKIPEKLREMTRIFITFHLVTFAWIFFRANSLTDSYHYINRLFFNWPELFIDSNSMAYGIAGITILIIIEMYKYTGKFSMEYLFKISATARWACIYLIIFLIILCGVGSDSAFIYFQF